MPRQACKEYLELATEGGQRWLRQFKKESTRRADLEQQLETMAKQLRSLEKHAQKAYTLQRAAGGQSEKASASASGSGSTRLAVSGAGIGSAVIITQPTSSGGANGGANSGGSGRSGGNRKRVPPGSTPQRVPRAGSVHSQCDSPISPLAVAPIRTPPDQPSPQSQSPASQQLTSSSPSFLQVGTSSLRVAISAEQAQTQQQRLAVARLAPNVSIPNVSILGSAGSTPSPSPSPSCSSSARPAPFSAAFDPPESTVADDGVHYAPYESTHVCEFAS